MFEALPLTELELEFGFVSAVDATSGIGRVYHFKQYTLGAELYVDQERFPNAWAYRGKELTRNSKPYKLVKAEFDRFVNDKQHDDTQKKVGVVMAQQEDLAQRVTRLQRVLDSPRRVLALVKGVLSPQIRETAQAEAKAVAEETVAPVKRKLEVTSAVASHAHHAASALNTKTDTYAVQFDARIGAVEVDQAELTTRVGAVEVGLGAVQIEVANFGQSYVPRPEIESRFKGVSEANLKKHMDTDLELYFMKGEAAKNTEFREAGERAIPSLQTAVAELAAGELI